MAISPSARIHPLACTDNTITVGDETRVWQFATVIRGTVLGDNCNVAAGANLDGPKFGDRCLISPGVDMGPGFEFGNDCFVGPNVVLCNDAWPSVSKEGWDYQALRDGAVTIRVGNGSIIGANAVILPGIWIGDFACIAAGAVCSVNVPSGCLLTRDGRLKVIDQDRAMSSRMRLLA